MKKQSSKSKSNTKAGRKRIEFQFQTDPNYDVYLSGSFNNWNGEATKLKDTSGTGKFSVSLLLPPGEHEYKFVVNGEWHVDPECTDWRTNEFGTLNSVIIVD